jgi:hypothetical protein
MGYHSKINTSVTTNTSHVKIGESNLAYIYNMYNKVVVKFIYILNKLLNTVHTPAFVVTDLMTCVSYFSGYYTFRQ